MDIYLVGGAVRDRLLGLPVCERDWVVVGASVEQMLAAGFRRADVDFPVFLHPQTGDEYALARREVKTGPGYKGFRIEIGADVTLEQDLARRDLTVNAIAEAADGRLIDPFGGQADLADRRLRHVTPAFVEDPVRVLRIARFAAKLGGFNFRVAHATHRLLRGMAAGGELASLGAERIWQEMYRALAYDHPWRFFEVLGACDALGQLLPELALAYPPSAHVAVSPPRAAQALRWVGVHETDPAWRFAVLYADLVADVDAVRGLCRRLRAPRQACQALRAVVAAWHDYPDLDAANAGQLYGFVQRHGGLRSGQDFPRVVRACEALAGGSGPWQRVQRAHAVVIQIQSDVLAARGLQGAALGEALKRERVAALEQWLAAGDLLR